MKTNFIITLGVLLAIFISCKKNKDDISYTSIVGFWKGKFGVGTSTPSTDRAFLFKSDGTVKVYSSLDTSAAQKTEDVWAASGNILNTGFVDFGTAYNVNMQGTINASFTRIEGTYGAGASPAGGGTFYLIR